MKKNILTQLKSEYEELEIKPSAGLWDKIETGLEKDDLPQSKQSFHWFWYAAAVIVMVSTCCWVYFFDGHSLPQSKVYITQETSQDSVLNNNWIPIKTIQEKNIDDNIRPEIAQKNTKISSDLEKIHDEKYPDLFIAAEPEKMPEVKIIVDEKIQATPKITVSEYKKIVYITSDDLLLGHELDKTREENYNDQRKFGVIDKSKIKGPNSLKILGFTIYSDSLNHK